MVADLDAMVADIKSDDNGDGEEAENMMKKDLDGDIRDQAQTQIRISTAMEMGLITEEEEKKGESENFVAKIYGYEWEFFVSLECSLNQSRESAERREPPPTTAVYYRGGGEDSYVCELRRTLSDPIDNCRRSTPLPSNLTSAISHRTVQYLKKVIYSSSLLSSPSFQLLFIMVQEGSD
ncbi:uncharacterized protein G2W53_035611 [Senna tora]|uniref:Uncharacterized protein n=1 Tax=Senna tora TaxID=362788 RepID=A0A834SQW5_9FABA|nr:uncharacterized protein G2W53_035611 [Senna tora]